MALSHYARNALVILALAVVPHAAFAANGCPVATSGELQEFLDQAIDTNENFKNTVFAGSGESESRTKEHEAYIRKAIIPCITRASALLLKQPDIDLMQVYISLIISYENVAYESIDSSFARIFVKNPGLVEHAFSEFSSTDHKLAYTSLSAGWDNIRGSVKPSVVADREKRLEKLNFD